MERITVRPNLQASMTVGEAHTLRERGVFYVGRRWAQKLGKGRETERRVQGEGQSLSASIPNDVIMLSDGP